MDHRFKEEILGGAPEGVGGTGLSVAMADDVTRRANAVASFLKAGILLSRIEYYY